MRISGIKKPQIAILVLLIVSYITTVRINGELTRLPTPLLLIIALFYFKLNIKANLYVIGFISFAVLHAAILLISGANIIEANLLLKNLFLYSSQIIVYSICFWTLNYDKNEDFIVIFFKIYVFVSITFWVGSYLSGINLAVEPSYLIPRAQGFVSEPSNLAHFIPALIIYFWKSQRYKWAFASAFLMFLAFSPTVYIAFLLTIVLLNLLTLNRNSAAYVLAIGLAISMIFIYWDNIVPHIVNLGQIGEVLVRIVDGVIFIFDNGAAGANSRALLIFNGIDFMTEKGLWWIGTGFGSSDAVAVEFNEGMLFDANNWFSFVLWFGLPALIFLLFIHFLVLVELRSRALHSKLKFVDYLLITMIVSNTINGGGVWVQQLFFAWIIFRLSYINLHRSEKNGVMFQ